jgi:spore germination protein YaaH
MCLELPELLLSPQRRRVHRHELLRGHPGGPLRRLVAALVASILSTLATPAAAQAEEPKVHALALEEHRHVPPPSSEIRSAPVLRSTAARQLTHKVYGYYPYWVSGWQNLRWELLSTLAYFSSEINEQGVITASHGWGGNAVNAIVQAAKDNGVRVVQTVTLFDNAAIGRLLASPSRRATAIRNIIDEIKRGGGEGVNIDFEFVPRTAKADFVTFMRDLTRDMHDEIPGSEVTIAMPAVDWSGAYDYDELALASDGLMIMAYGYHWTGGPPGPLSPLRTQSPWTSRSLTWTIDDYFRYGGAENRAKFILGLPFYGNDWPTTSDAVPGTSRGTGRAIVYRSAVAQAEQRGRRWESITSTPYYAYNASDGWHQVWYDDAESLSAKIGLVVERDIGGIGIWALGYDGTRPELFDTIEAKLSVPLFADGGAIAADGGAPADAGVPAEDAGTVEDAGTPAVDAGPPAVDAGAPAGDAGTPAPDAGGGGTAEPPPGGCNAVGGGANLALVALVLALAFLALRFR